MLMPYAKSMKWEICELLEARGMSDKYADDLPDLGYLYYSDNNEDAPPVAAGFVRFMEQGYAVMDSFITHPKYAPDIRSAALNEIMNGLIVACSQLGIKKILAFSLEKSLIERVCGLGFKRIPYEMAALDLKEG